MARAARVVLPAHPHHVVQRGNRRLDVFFSDDDRHTYRLLIRKASERHGVTIWAYCLMTNHVHFIAVPEKEDSLARCFSDAHVRYTRYVNSRQGWKGHLWQARFGSNVLDERHLIAAARYVERNPVRAGIVSAAWQYPWSSAAWHVGNTVSDQLVRGDGMLRQLVGNWAEYLEETDEQEFLKTIRRESLVNRPLADGSFIESLEKRMGINLVRRRAGRPKKEEKN